ncbi:MAG: FAD-dependent oxidoreductase [Cytophagales bacterium]|nr:FAD-dependent oxidoreductase [Armatimonadota bacterium]
MMLSSPNAAVAAVLDIENLRAVVPDEAPASHQACDVLVVGGGIGGVAAAEALIRQGLRVILTEPTHSIGGQFTTQLVPVPDESHHIELEPGTSTGAYRRLRAEVRAHYAAQPGVLPAAATNIGGCWVSRVSGTPDVWERLLRARLSRAEAVLMRHQMRSAETVGDTFRHADFVDLDSGRLVRIAAKFLLDATEDGSALELAGLPTTLGQESQADYGEPNAPPDAHPEWVQSFTYCFAVRWAAGGDPLGIVPRPDEYETFRAMGEYTLDYLYSHPPRTVSYSVLGKAAGSGGPFWTYRRLLAADSRGGASPVGDVALINWRGNDFRDEVYLGKSVEEQIRILKRGKAFAQGFLHWLQTECPRDEGQGFGYPEMQLVTGSDFSGIGADGFARHPYVRESRRLRAQFPLTALHLTTSATGDGRWGAEFVDSVGCAFYPMDIHPAKGEPHLLAHALPYHLPLGAFLTRAGAVNVLPAAKNFGASRLALASARMHPTEWLVGEVAGMLAAFCLREGFSDPLAVRQTPQLLREFQAKLRGAGIPLHWSEILPPLE